MLVTPCNVIFQGVIFASFKNYISLLDKKQEMGQLTKNIKVVNALFLIASILIVVGLVLRVSNESFYYVFEITGLSVGFIALIMRAVAFKKKSVPTVLKGKKILKMLYVIALILIVAGLVLRVNQYSFYYVFEFAGVFTALITFVADRNFSIQKEEE